jgi:putative endopeptidase
MVGYPDKWRDYSSLRIYPNDLLGNERRAKNFDWQWHVAQLSHRVDKSEWLEPAQMVDAYADVSRVVIAFPAAFLQAPFFDARADPAVNYGAIGSVIGHEITHQFDPTGRKFDATGRLRDWWTPHDAAEFEQRTLPLVTQYSKFEVLPGVFENGQLTLGENVADLGGLSVALDAYRAFLGSRKAPEIAGLKGEQRFFLGWAQFWRRKARDEVNREEALKGVHAIARFRVIGPTRNIDAWYEAFDVRPTDHYYLDPSARVRIW